LSDVGKYHPYEIALDPIRVYYEDWEEFWVLEYIEGRCTVEKLEQELDRILLDS
jgi:hypothetical protein